MAATPTSATGNVEAGQATAQRWQARRLAAFAQEAGELCVFGAQALAAVPQSLRYFSEVLRINARIVRRTSLLLLAMNAFLGFSVANFGFFFLRSIGGGDAAGVFTGLLTQRQTSITMFGYVMSAAVCCAMTAEIGAARIQQEIDAYESTGVDPRHLIVGTRLAAVLLFVPLGCVISLIGQTLGNYLDIVVVLQGNTSHQFLTTTFSMMSVGGHLYTLLTCFAMAVPCTIVACFYGMRASGGPDRVGAAVARGLILNLILAHVVSGLSGAFFYGHGNLTMAIGE